MSEQQILYRIVEPSVAAGDILGWLGGQNLVAGIGFGMVMSPHRFDLAKVTFGKIGFFQSVPDLDAAYEIRLFGPDTDARWQRDGATGCLTVLTVAGGSGTKIEVCDVLDRNYCLFGRAKPKDADWAIATSARIPAIPVPVKLQKESALQLTAVEHIGIRRHGNAVVVAERLTGIEAVPPAQLRKDI